MTLDEAIKINQDLVDGEYDHRDKAMEDALKLGIQALKRVKKEREIQGGLYNCELPGETED